jgi:hypothetical protein
VGAGFMQPASKSWPADALNRNEWTQSYLLQLEGARKQLVAPNGSSTSSIAQEPPVMAREPMASATASAQR